MKNFLDYLDKTHYNIYENFGSDHILTKEEIDVSYNRFVNEGFWDFLTAFFANLFGSNLKDEDRATAERIIKDVNDRFGSKAQNAIVSLLERKFKNADDAIAATEKKRVELLKKKHIKNEKDSYVWACDALTELKFNFDDDKDKDKIDEKIKEYDKKSGGKWSKLNEERKKKKDDDEDDENDIPKDFKENLKDAVKEYSDIVKDLASACNTEVENISASVESVCKGKKELLAISDPKHLLGFILMVCGGYLSYELPGNAEEKIQSFLGVGLLSLEQKK